MSESDSEDEEYDINVNSHNEVAKEEKIHRPPPIVIYSYIQNHMQSIENIKKNLSGELTIKNKGSRLILHTQNRADYDKLKTIVTDAKINYHTYTPKEDRDHKLVLKNLPPNISREEIMEDLKEKGVVVSNVTQMIKRSSDNQVRPLPLYIVTMKNTYKIKDIYNIKKYVTVLYSGSAIKIKIV